MARSGIVHVEVKGLKELNDTLREFSDDIRKRTMLKAAASAAKILRLKVVALAPEGSAERGDPHPGLLKRSIRQYVFSKPAIGLAVATVKPTKAVNYAIYLEFGTSKMEPRPFMRPAFHAAKFQATERFRESLAEKVAALKG